MNKYIIIIRLFTLTTTRLTNARKYNANCCVFVVMIEVMHQKDATEQNRLNRKIPDKMFPEERDQ